MHCIPKLKQTYRLSKHDLKKTKVEQMKLYVFKQEKQHIKFFFLFFLSTQQVNNEKKKKPTST